MDPAASDASPALHDWLRRHRARMIWRHETKGKVLVECYHVGKGIAVVTWFPSGGWDLFTAPSHTIDVTEALADAETRLGLK